MPEPRTDSSTATRPPLISAQPWSHEDARAGLIDRALAPTGTIGGNRVRVLPEPLRKDLDGVEVQAVRVLFADTASRALDLRVDVEGNDCVAGRADAPDDTSIRILVPVVIEATPSTLVIPELGDGGIDFTLMPQRTWSVHVVHHSHFDFGYTRPNRTPRATACLRLPQESVTE